MKLEDLVGMDILVGKTFLDADGEVLRQEQFHGEIVEADPSTTWIRPFDGGERQWVPTNPAAFRPAPGGTYRLSCSGRVVTDPTLLTSWMFTVLEEESGEPYDEAEPNLAPVQQSRVPDESNLTCTINEGHIRRAIELFGDEYIARTLLLGLTYTGPGGEFRRQEQRVETILWISFEDGIVVAFEPDGHQMNLPGDICCIEKAPLGEYRLRSSGVVVKDPDDIASFTIGEPE